MSNAIYPYDWYWLADDNRVYSSARQLIVDANDADYIAWSTNQLASAWPRDVAGNQTDAELQAVLDPYNLFVSLYAYSSYARWKKEQSGIKATISSGIMPIETNDRSQAKINGARIARDNNILTSANWYAADKQIYNITKDDVVALSNQLQDFIHDTFDALDTAKKGIDNGSIKTHEQVDAVYSAIPDTYTG
jgi:hypothetical protein